MSNKIQLFSKLNHSSSQIFIPRGFRIKKMAYIPVNSSLTRPHDYLDSMWASGLQTFIYVVLKEAGDIRKLVLCIPRAGETPYTPKSIIS